MEIESFDWDEENAGHVARHGLHAFDLNDVLENRFVVLRNKADASGEYRIVGRDYSGRLVTVVVVATAERGVWRPVTAWPAQGGDARYARNNNI